MKEIRLLNKTEISLRVGKLTDTRYGVYVNLLAHTDARTCSKILDETFTPTGWQREYEGINNELFCAVSVWDEEKKQWIKKSDVGATANDGTAKSCASDAFKRACVSHGVARELYSLKNISFKLDESEYEKKGDGIRTYAQFFVSEVAYDEKSRTFTELVVVDKNDKVRYRLSGKKEEAAHAYSKPEQAKSGNDAKPGENKGGIAKYCQDCKAEIQQNVALFSSKHFGMPLCYNCQQKHKAS